MGGLKPDMAKVRLAKMALGLTCVYKTQPTSGPVQEVTLPDGKKAYRRDQFPGKQCMNDRLPGSDACAIHDKSAKMERRRKKEIKKYDDYVERAAMTDVGRKLYAINPELFHQLASRSMDERVAASKGKLSRQFYDAIRRYTEKLERMLF